MSIFDNQEQSAPPKWRSWMHIAMGIVYVLFGIMIFKFKSFMNMDLSMPVVIGLSLLMGVYGAFRIWRGTVDLKAAMQQP